MLKIYRLKLKQNSYEVTIHYKGVGVRVAFTDGNIYNGTPARCYERDPFKQRAIEASPMFKNREIVIERTVEDKVTKSAPVSVRAKRSSRIGAPVRPASKAPSPAPKNPEVETPDTGEGAGASASQDADAAQGGNDVKFASLSDAIVHIMQNYDKEVHTANEARAFLKEQGITAHIKQG